MLRMRLMGGETVTMAIRVQRNLGLSVLLTLALLISACGTPKSSTSATSTTTPNSAANNTAANTIILAMLNNIKTNGFDSNAAINGGMGGLWINWRYSTNPLLTDFNGSGQPDGATVSPPRHDSLTDLRYLHNLWLYKALHPGDTQFDSEIARYTSIVKHDFVINDQGQLANGDGWVYDELIGLANLSQDNFYQQAAVALANFFDATLYNGTVGTVFKTDSTHPTGHYRVDLALEAGCALIQAGTLANKPQWVSDGRKTVAFVYAHAYVPDYHVLLFQMNDVLNTDGSVNPTETIDRVPYGHTKIEGGSVKLGEIAQEALSLLHAYLITKDQTLLTDATSLLDGFMSQGDKLGIWDAQSQGYFAAAVFPGPTAATPGTPTVNTKEKESGRQFQMLETFHLADTLTNNRYQATQDALLLVAVTKGYYAPGHGVLFQETADWQPLAVKGGGTQDWVTTEAMGIMLEGLQSLQQSNPW